MYGKFNETGMYGAYHHVSIAGKDDQICDYLCDVTGFLCENNTTR